MLLPKANKTSLAKLIRAKGYMIPSVYQATFSKCGRAYWLRWVDTDYVPHSAYYSAAGASDPAGEQGVA